MVNVWNDVRYALRGFRRAPLFTAIAVISLAFGIGANTAIFTLLDQILLRLLPVKIRRARTADDARPALRQQLGRQRNCIRCIRIFGITTRCSPGCSAAFRSIGQRRYEATRSGSQAELVSGGYFPMLGVERPSAAQSPR